MYNWKSCKLNGVEITKLVLNGNLVWEKPADTFIYYCTLNDDFDQALEEFLNLNLESMNDISKDFSEFISVGAGRPVVLTKGDINSVKIAFWVDKPVEKWFYSELSKGIVSIDDINLYDVAPQIDINGSVYTIWTPDGEDFDYIIPKGAKCKLIIS